MAKPDWAGPFGIPETEQELEKAFWTTLILYGVYTAAYALEVWRTIPRMAQHHYLNPSRNAIVRQAMRQTSFPSLTRGATMFRVWPSVALIAGMLAVKEYVGDPVDYQSDRDRVYLARTLASGGTGTHVIGDFHHSPYYESPSGDHVWYSFHPDRI